MDMTSPLPLSPGDKPESVHLLINDAQLAPKIAQLLCDNPDLHCVLLTGQEVISPEIALGVCITEFLVEPYQASSSEPGWRKNFKTGKKLRY